MDYPSRRFGSSGVMEEMWTCPCQNVVDVMFALHRRRVAVRVELHAFVESPTVCSSIDRVQV